MASKKMFIKNFGNPDERREFKGHGHLKVLKFDDGTEVGLGVFEPSWRWSNDVKPIVETESCEADHAGYCIQGSMTIRMNDGEEFEIKAGDFFRIPPGHDAWVNGSETCELVDVSGFKGYALKKGEKKVA